MKETRFKQTEIRLIPEDWEIRKLGSIFKFIPNNTISRDNLMNQGTVMNVHYGTFSLSTVQFWILKIMIFHL